MNIYQKLAEVRKSVEVMQRDAKAYGYNYVKEEDLLARITVGMETHGLTLIPGIVPSTTRVEPYNYSKTKTAKNGQAYNESVNEILVAADMSYTWVDNESCETITIPWAMVGQQSDASQAFGSGLTYANRYFLLKYFQVATPNDDPDNWRSKQREAEAERDEMVCKAIIEQIDTAARAYMSEHKEEGKAVRAFFGEYVKNSDYTLITDPALAARVLEKFNEKFGSNEK